MIAAIIENLERGKNLVNNVTQNEYTDSSVAPYFSSIGVHMRHVLDVFDCIFDGLAHSKIDLSQRKRNSLIEQDKDLGITYFEQIISKLHHLEDKQLVEEVVVKDDLGQGMVDADYTLAAILIQAHSHAIHHFASIGYIIHQLGISLPDEDFGYNPTTPSANKIIRN